MDITLEDAFRELAGEEAGRRYEAAIILGDPKMWLGLDPTPEIARRLAPLLNDENWEVRYYSAEALGKLCYSESIPFLEKIETDVNANVRKAARIALENIARGKNGAQIPDSENER